MALAVAERADAHGRGRVLVHLDIGELGGARARGHLDVCADPDAEQPGGARGAPRGLLASSLVVASKHQCTFEGRRVVADVVYGAGR